MRSIVPALIAALLVACRPQEPKAAHDAAFWKTAKCAQLNGLRFKAQFYKDNQKSDTDVLFFRHDSLESEKWIAAGFHTATCGCQDHGVGVIRIKGNMLNAANEWRMW